MEEPLWLTRQLVETLQADQVREHGGRLGLRDAGLESAIARAQHVWNYDEDTDLAALAAEYAFGLARNHAFLDERIAFVATNVFLILNGFEIDAAEPEVVDAMMRLASGTMSCDEFAAWVRGVVIPYKAT